MSKKARFILATYLIAALVTLSLCCAIGYTRLTDYRRSAAYSARASFETTVRAVDKMGTALKKGLYATDGGLCGSICGEVYAEAMAAEAAMASMPFATQELENLSGFLNLVGDYAYSLCTQAAAEGFDQEQREQLTAFSRQAGDFAGMLRDLQTNLNNGLVLLDSREQRLQNVGVENGEKLSAALLDFEAGFDGGELSYDGKFTAREEAQAGELSEEEARALAARVAGVEPRELKEEYDYAGADGRRCYSAGSMILCVSSRGLESIGQSRLVSSGRISTDKARQIAQEFLTQLELEEMALVSYSDSGTVASFYFAQVQDEALRLDSGVKVSVALDDGSIYAYNGEKYSGSQAEVQWNIRQEQAREKLPDNVNAQGVRRVIIQSAGKRDLPCYEFSCLDGEGQAVKIYVNADTGRQCKIEI